VQRIMVCIFWIFLNLCANVCLNLCTNI
jgi:hypothetical protein